MLIPDLWRNRVIYHYRATWFGLEPAPEGKLQNGPKTDLVNSGRGRSGIKILLLPIVLLIVGGIGGFTLRGRMDEARVGDANQRFLRYRSEHKELRSQIFSLSEKLERSMTEFGTLQAELKKIIPSTNTYIVKVNHAIIIEGGYLTVALIGPPTSEHLEINVNGKHHLTTAGDVIDVTPGLSLRCKVAVQSFDMFNVVIAASCRRVEH
jgi:hypothetical protein